MRTGYLCSAVKCVRGIWALIGRLPHPPVIYGEKAERETATKNIEKANLSCMRHKTTSLI